MLIRRITWAGILMLMVAGPLLGQEAYSLEEALKSPHNIERLFLSEEVIAEELYAFPNLKELRADHCQLSRITDEITRLQKLEKITVIASGLEHVSDKLRELPELQVIDFSGNPIANANFLPLGPKIREIRLRSCHLTGLPHKAFHGQSQLRYLDLADNKLEKIPCLKEQAQSLTSLILDMNELRQVRAHTMTNLEECRLRSNRFMKVPRWLKGSPKLKQLDLSHNPIEQLPAWLTALPALELIQLRGFSSPPAEFSGEVKVIRD